MMNPFDGLWGAIKWALTTILWWPVELCGRQLAKFAKTKIGKLLLFGETGLLRFFFGWCSLAFSVWVLFDRDYAAGHREAVALVSEHMQVILFAVHGISVLYGVQTGRFNNLLLMTEGILGCFLWMGLGLAETSHQGTPGPMMVAGFIALFLLIRYPTHYGVVNAD